MEKEYPQHLKQSESASLVSQPGTTHKETEGWTFGLARSDLFAGEASYQPDKCFKQPFLTDMSYRGKAAETDPCKPARLSNESWRETDPSLA